MNTKKILSFVKLCQRGCVERIILAEEFENFMNSNYEDAYEYYVNRGYHNLTEPITKIKICKWISESFGENSSLTSNELVGIVMKKSRGELDPNTIKEVIEDFFE